jgi:hypothetical protein
LHTRRGDSRLDSTWTTFNTQSLLGGALLGQKKYADAEPLLLKGYEGMKAREKSIPDGVRAERMTAALDALVKLYEATDKPDEVKKYRELRSKYPAASGTTDR